MVIETTPMSEDPGVEGTVAGRLMRTTACASGDRPRSGQPGLDGRRKEYLDLIAGIASVRFGHAHPALVSAVSSQVRQGRPHLQPVPARAEVALPRSC